MTSIGSGYDLSASTYSPDGRVFQIEYAQKAVDNSGTAIGIRCKDGVVLGVENIKHSKLLKPKANQRIQNGDLHIGVAFAGIFADGRALVNQVRKDSANHRNVYKAPISGKIIASQLGQFVQNYTLYSSVRPFGASVLLALMDKYHGPQLYLIEPSGVYWGYYGCAVGKGKQIAKTEIEKLDLSNLTARQAVNEVARILHLAHDESKDRDFELELSWICEETQMMHQLVPQDLLQASEQHAKSLQASEMDE